ncbi:MAG: helix-turn-helix domain-containing protein [Candidatus Brocadiales bacterium]
MVDISQRIRNVLQEKSLSQKDFAKALGFTPGYINDILRGRTTPSIRVVERLAQVFNVSTDWLLAGNGQRYEKRREKLWPEKVEVVTSKELLDKAGKFGRRRHDFVAVPVLDNDAVFGLPKKITNMTIYEPAAYCIVPYTWIPRPKTTFCHRVKDTNMEPTVPIESIVGVDCSIRTPSRLNGKLCVVRIKSALLLRRLRITKTHLVFDTETHLPNTPKPARIKIGSGNHIIGKAEWVHCFYK